MSDQATEQHSGLSRLLSLAKSLGDVVRTWGVLAIALLAVSQPALVRSWVRDAGIKKLLDVEFSEAEAKQLATTEQELKDARLVTAQLGETLKQAQEKLDDPNRAAAVPAEVTRDLAMAAQVAQTTSQQLDDTLKKVSPLAQKAEVFANATKGEWAVIFGGDANLEAARWEIERAASKSETDRDRLAIFLRDGSYRSLARYPNRHQAAEALKRFQKLRASAYVISLDRWCGKWKPEDGFFRCS